MSKKAFLVGINNFTRPDWQLNGCLNDTVAVRELLQSYFEFQDDDIKVIHDRDATTQGIRDGLGWLLQNARSGDVRIFHFSSHGTQVPDESDDEMDVQDEVIVPFDHDWSKPFRDDDLRAIFDTIPDGVNFTFIADCCHSGSIQKGLLDSGIEFKPRYLTPPPDIIDRIRELEQKRKDAADAAAAAELMQMLQDVPREEQAAKMAEYIAQLRKKLAENKFAVIPEAKHFLLAACEDRQTAADAHIEGDYHGAFTWALYRGVKEAQGSLTYDDVIARISANLSDYDQIPQLECPTGVRTLKLFAPLVP